MKISSATIEALRPEPVSMDPAWSQETLAAILADQRTPHAAPGRRTRTRAVVVGLSLAATSTLGVGVAVAAGDLKLQAFTDVFSFWKETPAPGQQGVDPALARRVATAPGPHGTVFSVLTTDGEYACRTAVLETATSAQGDLPSSFTDVTSNWCSTDPLSRQFGGATVDFQRDVAGFIVTAGNAARAEVKTPDGQEYPALLVDGHFWGWFPKDAHPTLVGYTSDGTVIGRVDLGTGTDPANGPENAALPTPEPSN